ncbi:MAG: hypothetical protein HFG62_02705 [Lachnospiraceae bacterium]|nr:hypothetical protein [Lachnospiraceae bacterium]
MQSTDSKRHTTWDALQKESIFGQEKTRKQVMEEIMAEPDLYQQFLKLSPRLQEELVEFAMGVRGLNVTYDPVFKKIFDPETRKKRLEEFLSLCMKQKVKILRVLPSESQRLTEEGSLLVMDILVQLRSGALVNVEIQRIGYAFPGARCACYSSDLLMRQYSQVREATRKEDKKFNYKEIKGVYTIVLVQQSTAEFRQYPEDYLHYFGQASNTGLKLDLLQKYLLIPLDIFLEYLHNKRENRNLSGSRKPRTRIFKNKLEAWLTFIASDKPDDIMEVVRAYPEFREPYKEVFAFRYQQRELISMYSKALSILDANTVEYMVEQQRKEILELTEVLKDKDRALEDKDKALEAQKKELDRLRALLAGKQTAHLSS